MKDRVQEIMESAHNLSEEEAAKFISDFEFVLDSAYQVHKSEMENKNLIIESLLLKLNNKDIEVLNIEDICSIFSWEEQKARKFLKMAVQMKYATKIGKQTIITKSELEKYLTFLKGKELTI